MSDAASIAQQVAHFMSEHDSFARLLGMQLLEVRPGYSRATMQITPVVLNGHGLPHGAVIFALADFAFEAAGNSHGQTALALSMDIHFLRSPHPDSTLSAEAVEVRRGNRTALYRITVQDEQNNLIAELHGMVYRKKENFLENEPV